MASDYIYTNVITPLHANNISDGLHFVEVGPTVKWKIVHELLNIGVDKSVLF